MSGRQVVRWVGFVTFFGACCRFLVETEKDIFGINQGDDAVEIDGAAQAIINPEQRR